MTKKIIQLPANGMTFHCELRGNGPPILLVPDGCNDCEPYDRLSRLLADGFSVVTFDMRGGSRSPDPEPGPITPRRLADDLAAIVGALDLGRVGVYGCSSGGQAVLALGKYYPEIVRNIAVHEAALQSEAPLPDSGFQYFANLMTFAPHLTGGVHPMDLLGGNADAALIVGPECRQRMAHNSQFWRQHYLGHVDKDTYSEADFASMPPVDFTVGAWSPAWLVYANLATAQRGARSVTWVNCAHHPELTCPEDYAVHLARLFNAYA